MRRGGASDLGLAPQVSDVHVERLRRRFEVVAPDALVDGVARDDDAGVEHQELEEIELGLGELELDRAAPRLASHRVEHEIGDRQLRVAVGDAAAPQQRANACEELVQREGLHEVVVRARVEACDPVRDLVAGRQHQYRRVVAAVAQDATDGQPVGAWHQHVEHDHVGRQVVDAEQRVVAVDGGVHVVAFEPKRALDRLAHVRVVFDDEDAVGFATACGHVFSLTRRSKSRPRSRGAVTRPLRRPGPGRITRWCRFRPVSCWPRSVCSTASCWSTRHRQRRVRRRRGSPRARRRAVGRGRLPLRTGPAAAPRRGVALTRRRKAHGIRTGVTGTSQVRTVSLSYA